MLPMRVSEMRSKAAVRRARGAGHLARGSDVFMVSSAEEAPAEPAASGVHGVAQVSDISVLMAVQGVDNGGEQRRKAIRQGHETLNALDGLKVDLLSGQLTSGRVRRIEDLLAREREAVDDPALHTLLDHIELRARVELAKLEQRRR